MKGGIRKFLSKVFGKKDVQAVQSQAVESTTTVIADPVTKKIKFIPSRGTNNVKGAFGKAPGELGFVQIKGDVHPRHMRMLHLRMFRCEWCKTQQPYSNLYSWNGAREFTGPICKQCEKEMAVAQ